MSLKRKSDGTNASLSELFSNLTIAASSNDYERALIISDELLKSSPTDPRVARQKIIALIKLDRYKDALSFIEECTFLNGKDLVLEKGFCLYKLGNGPDAENILQQGTGRGVQHIRAQNAYRMEDFLNSMKLYAELLQSNEKIDHEIDDIVANYSAARAQHTWNTGIEGSQTSNSREGYEVYFNLAYEKIALGKFEEAEGALNQAQKLCGRSGLSGDELRAEQGIILTQLAYIKQLRGFDTATVRKLYEDIQNQPSVDTTTRAIAINNQLSLEPRANPFENLRLLTAAAHSFAHSKPFSAQSQPFSSNSLLLSAKANKSRIVEGIKRHQKVHTQDYSASLIRLHGLPEQSEPSFLTKLSETFHSDESDVAIALLLIQTHASKGNIQTAATTLEKLYHALKDKSEVKYAPGLVSLAMLLFPKIGKEERATIILLEAKNYWSKKQNLDSNASSLINYATLARLDQLLSLQPSLAHAQEIDTMIAEQEAYLKEHPSDISTQAVLAALYSTKSATEQDKFTSSLPPVSSFTTTADVKLLESQGVPTTTVPVAKRKVIAQGKPRKRRIRGGKVFDPSNTIDPERWLPMRDRSYYKPSKSKKRKPGGATQGGAMETEVMERSDSGHVESKKGDTGGKKKKKNRK